MRVLLRALLLVTAVAMPFSCGKESPPPPQSPPPPPPESSAGKTPPPTPGGLSGGPSGGQTGGSAEAPPAPPIDRSGPWAIETIRPQYVTSVCLDGQGMIWVGTDDQGVWRMDPYAPAETQWTQFTRDNTGGGFEVDGPAVTTQPAGAAGPASGGEPYLGDDYAYALACDKLGRIWVGHLNHGVSVYDGRPPKLDAARHYAGWRNYDVLAGPLGERVFAIKTCPVDGDVWIATSGGLARYRVDQDHWSYYTKADGFPSDQVQALAFDRDGTLYAATQIDGLVIGAPAASAPAAAGAATLEYQAWRQVRGPYPVPTVPIGEGLPSNLINDVLVGRDGTLYVATLMGLAWSKDKAQTFRFRRGLDWEAKTRELYHPPTDEALAAATQLAAPYELMQEDYVSCLAEDAYGQLWVGHWTKGYEVLDAKEARPVHSSWLDHGNDAGAGWEAPPFDYVMRILPGPVKAGPPAVARYGGGIAQAPANYFTPPPPPPDVAPPPDGASAPDAAAPPGAAAGPPLESSPSASVMPKLPSPAPPPSAQELAAILAQLRQLAGPNAKANPPNANPPGADAPGADAPGADAPGVNPPGTTPVLPTTRPAATAVLRPRPRTTAPAPSPATAPAPRLPSLAAAAVLPDDWRTQGDWMGRYGRYYAVLCAAASPMNHVFNTQQGCTVAARIGPHVHAGGDSMRYYITALDSEDRRVLYDPLIGHRRQSEWVDNGQAYPPTHQGPDLRIKVTVPDGVHRVALYFFNPHRTASKAPWRDFTLEIRDGAGDPQDGPVLARSRARDSWGVYKNFVVQGPASYWIEIDRNGTMNANCAGVFIDRLDAPASDYAKVLTCMVDVRYAPPLADPAQALARSSDPATLQAALALADPAFLAQATRDRSPAMHPALLLAYRAVRANGDQAVADEWRWRLRLWEPEDRRQFTAALQKGWERYTDLNPRLKSRKPPNAP